MITVRIEGLERVMGKLEPALWKGPLREFLEAAALGVERDAKKKAPVDTGRLRSSITHEVEDTLARVGTDVDYAAFMEYGTGTQTDGPGGGGRHWPPTAGLDPWAARKGLDPFLVARAIGRRGGLVPRRYLRGALEENLGRIKRLLGKMGEEIRGKWDSQ